MALHILKLAVGCDTIKDLTDWISETQALFRRLGRPYEQLHTTRMVPKRLGELTAASGSSLYWVIKGRIMCRQPLLEIRPFKDESGIGRCHLVLDPTVMPVSPRPMRPFQGWRYLEGKDAPPDLGSGSETAAIMPETMRRELAELGLL
jgi:hypothetical protein